MSAADAAVGIMDGAYFVGRKELLDFFNNLLDIQLTKIEQTAPGAIACQVTDLIFPHTIPMSRVNWEAKSDYEFVQNYKLLQAAFTKHRVQRHVDVDKLIRAKYQDNLEFCQWLKAFYDQAVSGGGTTTGNNNNGYGNQGEDYDPALVRAKGKGGKKFNQQHGSGRRGGTTTTTNQYKATTTTKRTTTAPRSTLSERNTQPQRPTPTTTTSVVSTENIRNHHHHILKTKDNTGNNNNNNDDAAMMMRMASIQGENTQLIQKVSDLENTLEEVERERDQIVMDVEKERDFYFGKLRSIEVMLQVHQEEEEENNKNDNNNDNNNNDDKNKNPVTVVMNSLVERMFQILYATAEDNLTVNSEGQVVEASTLEEEDEQQQQQEDGAGGGDEEAVEEQQQQSHTHTMEHVVNGGGGDDNLLSAALG